MMIVGTPLVLDFEVEPCQSQLSMSESTVSFNDVHDLMDRMVFRENGRFFVLKVWSQRLQRLNNGETFAFRHRVVALSAIQRPRPEAYRPSPPFFMRLEEGALDAISRNVCVKGLT